MDVIKKYYFVLTPYQINVLFRPKVGCLSFVNFKRANWIIVQGRKKTEVKFGEMMSLMRGGGKIKIRLQLD